MISWIQRTFQHHFRAVFAVLLAVTIISFIATIGAAPGIGNGERKVTEADFYGHNLANGMDVRNIMMDGDVSIELQAPQEYNYLEEAQRREYAFQRVAALALADQWHLPPAAPDSPQMVDFIKRLPVFAGPDGQFDPQRYAAWRARARESGENNEEAYMRIISDDERIQRVEMLLGGPGYILPSDVRDELTIEDTAWTISTATVDYAAFKGPTELPPAAVERFFQANISRYMIPAKVSVGYVDFPDSRYLSQVQVTDAEVRAYYDRNPARFPKPLPAKLAGPLKAPAVKSDPNADFAAVRPEVEKALKLERAHTLAVKDASDFTYALYQAKVSPGPTLQAFLAAHHVEEKSLPSFSADAAPAELGGTSDVATAAFALNQEHFFSEATPTPDGAVVMLWKGDEAPRQPLLAEVRSRVDADYLADRKRAAFMTAGATLKADIAARMKQGLTFDKAAAAAGAAEGLKVTVKNLPTFKMSDRPSDVDPALMQMIDNLTPGKISNLTFLGSEGVLVYDQARKAPNLTASSVRFASVRAREAMVASHMTASQVLGELVDAKLKGTPLDDGE